MTTVRHVGTDFETVQRAIERTPSGFVFTSEFCTILATEKQAECVEQRVGETVIYGVRPEYLNPRNDQGEFTAELDVIEPLGDRDAVHLSANGTSLSAVTSQGEISKETNRVHINIETEESWLFEENGRRIV